MEFTQTTLSVLSYVLVKAHLSMVLEIYTPWRNPGGVDLLRLQLRCALSDLYHVTMALTVHLVIVGLCEGLCCSHQMYKLHSQSQPEQFD